MWGSAWDLRLRKKKRKGRYSFPASPMHIQTGYSGHPMEMILICPINRNHKMEIYNMRKILISLAAIILLSSCAGVGVETVSTHHCERCAENCPMCKEKHCKHHKDCEHCKKAGIIDMKAEKPCKICMESERQSMLRQ